MNQLKYCLLSSVLLVLSGCDDDAVPPQTGDKAVADTALCDFHAGPCQNQGDVLALTPAHAPSEQPLSLALQLQPGESVVKAQLKGRDMYMGVIPVRFDANGNAQTMVGSCASDYMVWRLTAELAAADGSRRIIEFDWLADASQQ